MAKLSRTHHQLAKAEKKLRKYSKNQKQFQIQFVRQQRKNGKFKTIAYVGRGEKSNRYTGHGLIHRAVNLKTRVVGDKPSITKCLDSLKPKELIGKGFKRSAQLVNATAHTALHTAEGTVLGAETVTLKTTQAVERNVWYKLKQKYRQEAIDDYHRGTIATLGITKDTVVGTRRHFKQKKQFKLEKARYKVKKAEYKLFKGEQYKPKLAKSRKELKEVRLKFKKRKKSFKRFRKYRKSADKFTKKVNRGIYKKRRKQYRIEAKKFKTLSKKLKKEKKFQAKALKKQWRIADLSRPAPIILKPASYTGKRLSASGWQKAVNSDEDNDFLYAVEYVKRHGVNRAANSMSPQKLKERNQKKKDRLEKKQGDTHQRLQKREDKLKSKGEQNKHRRKKSKKPPKESFGDRFKNALKEAFNFVKNIYNREARNILLACLVPILIIALVLAFILMFFSSILGGSGFVLGTYASQDYDLSEAEKYYTKLAYDLNEKILKVSNSDTWQSGLIDFGAVKKNIKDKPDNWYWGNSSVYNWDPVYDFDVYKLWSFLCAYYYDFDADDNGDIRYWEFDGDTEDLLEEIFSDEYEFVYWYDNQSRWEELSPYNYWGGGNAESGTYYRAEKDAYTYNDQPYKYRFKPIAYTSELSQYFDSEGYVCINSDLRVLNPNDDYELTGFRIMDHRWYSGTSEPFYYIDSATNTFFFMHNGTRYDRSFWGWDGNDAWFLVSPTDTHIWNDSINDACMYGYYEQYYVEGDHEAIIPKDIYLQVQEELVRRRVGKTSANGKKRNYSCNHCFSQIVICGECGEMFRRLHWNNRGVKSIVWRCISRLESTGLECHARTINELVLQDVVVKAINQMLGDKSNYQAQLQLNIAAVIRASQATAIDSIDEKLMALQQELIQKANIKEDYDEIADEIFRLRELRQKTTVDTAARDEQIKRINDLQDYITQQTTYLTEFDEALVRRWVKQITIWDDRITVELKSGVSIDVDA